jgi:hypothetical protein
MAHWSLLAMGGGASSGWDGGGWLGGGEGAAEVEMNAARV